MTQQDEDKKKMLLALAVGVGSTAKTYEELTEDEIREAVALYKAKGLDKRVESGVTLTEQETQALVATALMDTYEYFKVVNLDDERTCQACKEWIGRILTIHGEDPRYKTVDDFIRSGGLHPNCRCTLQRATVKKPSTKELTQMAQNAEPIGDQPVYRGFVDADLDKDIQYNFDETLVMLTPVGKFVGSAPDGTPTTEIVDEQSIQQMAQQTEELLLDKDHASMRGPEDRDTEAYGWISGLRAVTGLGDMSGLYGIIKWTSKGIALARDRIYRFLSPVFELDAQGRATKLINVALTNRPALPLPPIINSEPEDTTTSMTQTQKDTDNMNKEEIAELVKQEVAAALAAAKEAANEEAAPAEKPEEMPAEKPAEEAKPAEPEAKPVEEAKNEDVHVDVFEEKKEQPEVIKAETLNSSPVIGADASEPWRKLHGQEFFTYLRQHPEAR